MHKFSSLIVIISIVLVGQTMASSVPLAQSLIKHPTPTEVYTKEQLMQKLDELSTSDDEERQVPVSVYVARLLYGTKDKNSTFVIDGVTVAELVQQNNLHLLADCSNKAFEKRYDIHSKIMSAYELPERVHFGLNVYLLKCLHLVFEHCLEHKDQIISEGINDEQTMAGIIQNEMDPTMQELSKMLRSDNWW